MAKYKIKHTTILHNKKTYSEGSTIELTDNEAKRLEDFVELIPNQVAQQTKTTKTKKTEEKVETVAPTKDEGVKDGE